MVDRMMCKLKIHIVVVDHLMKDCKVMYLCL